MKYQLFIALTIAAMGCGIWNKPIWIFLRDYVRPLWIILDKGSVLYKPEGSKLGNIIIITLCIIHSVPLIPQLEIYYGKISWNTMGIISVLIQESIALTFSLYMGKKGSI